VDILFGGFGDLGRTYREVDWERSPLGPVASWDETLRNAADLVLRSKFPMTLLWGPEFTLVYNDAYIPLIGDKHPSALGRPAKEVFPEAWDFIGPLLDSVMSRGEAVWVEETYLPLHRHGFLEECWFTFSYSPVRDVTGTVCGVLDVAAETTTQAIATRRLHTLSRLSLTLADVEHVEDVRSAALPVLRAAERDLDAVDLLVDGQLSDDPRLTPPPMELPYSTVRLSEDHKVAWLPLHTAVGPTDPVLVVALSPELAPDEEYLRFLRLVAAALRQAYDRVGARAAERQAADVQARMWTAFQRSLLPEATLWGMADVAVRYQPALELAQVGGDWYDLFELPDHTLTVVVGDVAGHDQRSAAAMAQARNMLRGVGYTMHPASPAEVLGGLDRAVLATREGIVATAVLAQVRPDVDGGLAVRWSNAGHPPPVLIETDGTSRLLATDPNTLLGAIDDARRVDHELRLAPGATLVLYTDGLVERRGAPVASGLDWLVGALEGHHLSTVEQICDDLLTAIDVVEDDVVLLVLRA
jgi:serine phosphatase RsbU (regulator of sigma subunit)